MEGDLSLLMSFITLMHFNPLPPHGGRHGKEASQKDTQFISIHSLRMEGDREKRLCHHSPQPFQSTPSAWRETIGFVNYIAAQTKISIHSLRMEGDSTVVLPAPRSAISIHSLRMEGDSPSRHKYTVSIISIHSLRMEGDRRTDQNGPP